MNHLNPLLFQETVVSALREDLGRGDLTSEGVVPDGLPAQAKLIAKASGCIAGLPVAAAVFRAVDPELEIKLLQSDGDQVEVGTEIMRIGGNARSILSAERVALNFLQRLSGIATETRKAVTHVAGTQAVIVDTRKTTPGLRLLEKYAVRAGGGKNHRYGLDDAVMIKENHIRVAGGIAAAVAAARQRIGHMHRIEVEIEALDQIGEALTAGVDVILLDNMSIETMTEAVLRIGGAAVVEASGGITPQDVRAVAQTGVDVISLGWLTHSAPALDLSLQVVTA